MARNNPPLPLATGPILRLTVVIKTLNTNLIEIGLDYMGATPLGVSLAVQQAWLTAWIASNQLPWTNTIANIESIVQYRVAEIQTGVTPTLVQLAAAAGTIVTVSDAGIDAVVVSKFSAIKGQHGRGRMYLGPIPGTFTTDATDPNVINAAGLAKYALLNAALILPVAAGGIAWNWCICTRPIPPQTLTLNATVVTSTTTQPIIGTIRRRREGRGI